jgi:hypothetical protein
MSTGILSQNFVSFRQGCVNHHAGVFSALNRIFQNAANGCTPELRLAGDLGFAYSGAVKFPNLDSDLPTAAPCYLFGFWLLGGRL